MQQPKDRPQDRPLSTAEMASAAQQPAAEKPRKPTLVERPPRDAGAAGERSAPLFSESETQQFRSRWDQIQTGFVDEPRRAVEQADELVAQTMKRLAEIFAEERNKLESQWDRGDNISTEDLRQALRRYRSFFDRLLSV